MDEFNESCYSEDFKVMGDTCPHPTKANTYESIDECVSKYDEFCHECENIGFGEPLPLFVYLGKPDGDELTYGYPNYPDYIVEKKINNKIMAERAW